MYMCSRSTYFYISLNICSESPFLPAVTVFVVMNRFLLFDPPPEKTTVVGEMWTPPFVKFK